MTCHLAMVLSKERSGFRAFSLSHLSIMILAHFLGVFSFGAKGRLVVSGIGPASLWETTNKDKRWSFRGSFSRWFIGSGEPQLIYSFLGIALFGGYGIMLVLCI